ncbi:hypothetical protein M427DRAFT_135510 [Gonapodya prolifera JEL478]|uniref:Uncharacterized protein n=1 Tax=Gonapodya prolifera (strain JEL478) TaxID=1344416 RepID=A0A139ADE7_GONPJ|nr:hypothetical protein M427DRAFT_135510 [Gonapodya prolifera JEL478]|eukprot:KXS14821.1 hypothetical protein M427DRAFT_135510 [Gonapodya prolifera JEL478]
MDILTPRVDNSDLSFVSQWTAELDEAALLERVAQHWKGMFGSWTHMYRCMQSLTYLLPRISRHPVYKEMLAAKSSGTAAENILPLDVADTYWKFGLNLYQDGRKLSGTYTLFGDITDDSFFVPCHSTGSLQSRTAHENIRDHGPGVLFGGCVGVSGPDAPVDWMPTPDGNGTRRALHSATSLTALAREIGFGEVDVSDVQALFQGVEQERMENRTVEKEGGSTELEKLQEGVKRSYLAFTLRKAR